jgi:hypothetical protein
MERRIIKKKSQNSRCGAMTALLFVVEFIFFQSGQNLITHRHQDSKFKIYSRTTPAADKSQQL